MQIFNDILLPILATVITGLASWGVSALVSWLKTKVKNENLQRALSTAEGIISATVKEVAQTFVDTLKKEGKFDEKAQELAFKKAYGEVVAQLTDEQTAALKSVTSDVELYIRNLIESKVKEAK